MNSIAKAVGLGNLRKGKRPENEDIDLEVEEDETEATEDAGSIEVKDGVDETTADEVADEVIEEAKDEAAKTIEEVAPAAVKKPANPAPKEGKNMKRYSLEFFETVNNELYNALVSELGVSSDLHGAILDLTALYPELRKDILKQSEELDYQPPKWGWRYKAVGCCKGKTFNSKEEAEEEATDLLNFGHKFSELFIRAPYYIGKDGKFGKKVPEKSRDYELIMAAADKASSTEGEA